MLKNFSMSQTMKLMLSLSVLIAVCAVVLWFLKPTEQHNIVQEHQAERLQQNTAVVHQQNQIDVAETKPSESVQQLASEAQLIAQRDRIYREFGDIAMAMMEGQKPDLNQLSEMLKQHQNLVEQGVISVEDAQNYLEYLSKVFPEMLPELNSYLQKLEDMPS